MASPLELNCPAKRLAFYIIPERWSTRILRRWLLGRVSRLLLCNLSLPFVPLLTTEFSLSRISSNRLRTQTARLTRKRTLRKFDGRLTLRRIKRWSACLNKSWRQAADVRRLFAAIEWRARRALRRRSANMVGAMTRANILRRSVDSRRLKVLK